MEKLYNNAVENDADISVCGFDRIDLDTQKLYSREMCKDSKKNFVIKENPGALLELNGAPWNKIYKAELLKNMYELKTVPKVLDDMMFLQLIYLNAKKGSIYTRFINLLYGKKRFYYKYSKERIIRFNIWCNGRSKK